jgi:NADH dehydrogenase [ubiquinone] 1 alpha subcomplex assembly factor 7
LLSLWCAQAWRDQGAPAAARLVEFGPGRGTMIADVVRAGRIMPAFLDAIDIVLIETSPGLKAAQRRALEHADVPVSWVRSWNEIATDRPVFVLANEFLDALPIHQYVMTERGWCERLVQVEGEGRLISVLAPFPAPIDPPAARSDIALGTVYEVAPAAQALVEDVSRTIAGQGGAALFVDYGYATGGFGDTLQAVSNHGFADVFESPGESDLSAHVDFAAMARRAQSGGAMPYGPVEQGQLLASLGIAQRAAALVKQNPGAWDAVTDAVNRLTDPKGMGTLFKALAIAPPGAPPPPGF